MEKIKKELDRLSKVVYDLKETIEELKKEIKLKKC
jgi:archaellum component FlaC